MDEKFCLGLCGEVKPLSEFSPRQTQCKACRNAKARKKNASGFKKQPPQVRTGIPLRKRMEMEAAQKAYEEGIKKAPR